MSPWENCFLSPQTDIMMHDPFKLGDRPGVNSLPRQNNCCFPKHSGILVRGIAQLHEVRKQEGEKREIIKN